MHVNINGLLKIDELRYIARSSIAAVIGMTETKLDNTVYDSEITVDGYNIVQNDRNRNGGGVACYITINICFTRKTCTCVIDTAISDHSLIYCTRKIPKAKYNRHKETTFSSLKNYLPDAYKGTLERISFPNYENFDNPDVTYSDFITRLDCVTNAIAPFKTVRIKNNASEWFDGEIAEKIHTRDKLYKKFKSTKLHIDEEIYKEVRNTVQNLLRKKKKAYFEEKLKENTANPKKTLENIRTARSARKKVTFH